MTARTLLPRIALLAVAACDPEVGGLTIDEPVEFRCATCGPTFNTPFNGALNWSAIDTLGNMYQDIRLDGVKLFGGTVTLDAFWADKGQLFGSKTTGTFTTIFKGHDFLGAELHLTAWGNPLALLVADVDAPNLLIGEKFWLYRFLVDESGGGAPNEAFDLCVPREDDGDVRALVHDDLDIDPETGDVFSRPNTVYIACMRGAAAEVAYAPLGYGFRPFELGLDVFELAMRFLRADYCFEGKPWTEFGQPITYLDKWGIGPGFDGHVDAVWALDGVRCIGEELRAGLTYDDIECAGPKPPMCDYGAAKAHYLAGSRIWSGIPD